MSYDFHQISDKCHKNNFGYSEKDEDYELKLSDAFTQKDKSGRFEWTARVLNINKNFNLPLQNKCKPLYDYIQFTSRINENKKKGMTIEKAVNEAVDWAINENLLEGYIKKQKAEGIMNLLTEYDEEASIRGWRRDGRQEKAVEAAIIAVKEFNATPEVAAQKMDAPLELVLEGLKKKEYS